MGRAGRRAAAAAWPRAVGAAVRAPASAAPVGNRNTGQSWPGAGGLCVCLVPGFCRGPWAEEIFRVTCLGGLGPDAERPPKGVSVPCPRVQGSEPLGCGCEAAGGSRNTVHRLQPLQVPVPHGLLAASQGRAGLLCCPGGGVGRGERALHPPTGWPFSFQATDHQTQRATWGEGHFSLPEGSLTSSPQIGSPQQLYLELQKGIPARAQMFLPSASWGELGSWLGRQAVLGAEDRWRQSPALESCRCDHGHDSGLRGDPAAGRGGRGQQGQEPVPGACLLSQSCLWRGRAAWGQRMLLTLPQRGKQEGQEMWGAQQTFPRGCILGGWPWLSSPGRAKSCSSLNLQGTHSRQDQSGS